jgi:hypothetical protein
MRCKALHCLPTTMEQFVSHKTYIHACIIHEPKKRIEQAQSVCKRIGQGCPATAQQTQQPSPINHCPACHKRSTKKKKNTCDRIPSQPGGPRQQGHTPCNVETYAAVPQPSARVMTQHLHSHLSLLRERPPSPLRHHHRLQSRRRTALCGYPSTWSTPPVGAWHSSGYPGRWAVTKRATTLSSAACIKRFVCMTGR